MKKTALILSLYAGMLLLGGFIGYFAAGSILSLITSSLSCALLCIGIYALLTNNFWGYPFSIVVTGVLSLFFLYRFVKTGAIMPAGGMTLFSISYLVFLSFAMVKQIRMSRKAQSYR